jgi:hypothetical protein
VVPAGPTSQAAPQAAPQAGYHVMAAPAYPANAGLASAGNPLQERPQLAAPAATVQQALRVLRESAYPDQREWAASCLAAADWRAHPEVIDALATAARKDSAATVRVWCVRALARLNANTMTVMTALHELQGDRDPRVRNEVGQALTRLQAGQPIPVSVR